MPDNSGAQRYFDSVPGQWDALYSHEDRVQYLVNRALRKGLYGRYRFTFDQVGDLHGGTVLDLGCGSGRYSVECAKRGAQKVVGIDFAPHMIEFSRRMAAEMGVSDVCEFVCDDFVNHEFTDRFDVVLGLGVFDYVADPAPVFAKTGSLQPRLFVASFPKFTPVWGTQRRVRYYWIKKCPVYDYAPEQVERLSRNAGFKRVYIRDGKHGFMLAAGADA
jgi:SAM-dependent methyltransferase